jgi:hypothetical protein
MNREDIMRMAKEVWSVGYVHERSLEKFAALVAANITAPDVQPVAFRFKERPDDLRSAWLYVDKKKNVPRGFNCQHLYIIPQTKRNEEPVAWSIARVIEDDDGRPIGQDEPEVVWGRYRPDEDGFTPLYAHPPAADVQPVVWKSLAFAKLGVVRHKMLPHEVEAVQRFLNDEYASHPPAADVAELVEALKDLLYQAKLSEDEGGWDFEQAQAALAKWEGK